MGSGWVGLGWFGLVWAKSCGYSQSIKTREAGPGCRGWVWVICCGWVSWWGRFARFRVGALRVLGGVPGVVVCLLGFALRILGILRKVQPEWPLVD